MSLRDDIDRPVHTRPCAVAGRFYPADPVLLRHDLQRYLNLVNTQIAFPGDPENRPIRVIVAPHAGYVYSAPIAASAYRRVAEMAGQLRRVVLIGPSHYVGFSGLACSSAAAFDTPFGRVPVDLDATGRLLGNKHVCCHDEAHAPEHGLEVHLPFLIHTLYNAVARAADLDKINFSIIPLLFGDIGHEPVADALDGFFDDPATLIVVSSDLSHYHDYDSAKRIDRVTADAIVAQRGDVVSPDRACGHTAIRAAMRCANTRNLDVIELDLRNSGDTAGSRDRVVGYGAFMIR